MDIKKYLPTSEAVTGLLAAHDSGAVKHLLAALIARAEEEDAEMMKFPRLDNADVRRDVRYRLGMIAGLRWAAELKKDTEQFVKNVNQKPGGV